MKTKYFITALSVCLCGIVSAQNTTDTTKMVNLSTVEISANKMPVTLKNNPGAVSVVNPQMLSVMPKSIGVEEALRLVPGVRVDNQHDGERVHLSIRGQGILTERGLRGIGVVIDGIPVNDPSGFAPDLYDVDWTTVSRIEVLRGPAGIYGGGGAAGILNIITKSGGQKPVGGEVMQVIGSNGFYKSFVQLDGTIGSQALKMKSNSDYRVSYSRSAGDGYRDHQGFYSNKLYEKLNFRPSDRLTVTQVISHTDYFQQNPEGLAFAQLDNVKQANPDANPFNEYQKTNRTTVGITGNYAFNSMHDVSATGWYRTWNYKETSNKAAEYRTYVVPGASLQFNLHLGQGALKNHLSIGAEYKSQQIGVYKLQSASDPNRKESMDETNLETTLLLANQIITQSSAGLWASWKLELNKLNVLASIRYDDMQNELTNKMMAPDTATTSKDFNHTSARIGVSYNLVKQATVFANFSQGFLPPSTEELANNPVGYSGFNTHLVPATSNCFEGGLRGLLAENLYYELTGFVMTTTDDFFRFKQSGRGNQEVFYGNAGNSNRKGIEAFVSYRFHEKLSLQVAYTYADYKYKSGSIDPVYTDTAYVLTAPPADGQQLPNSPKHQLFAEATWAFMKNLKLTVGTEFQSEWAIYTDAKAYNGELDPVVYKNWQDGFNLWQARLAYDWQFKCLNGELSLSVRNLTGEKYMAFTEPDPDGNSYQPGPGSEVFAGLKIGF